MLHSPAPHATARAIKHLALQGDVVDARHGAGIAALILTLLLRLLARTDAAWDLPPEHRTDAEYPPHALIMPTMGRAPHAAAFEAGHVPDWIFTSRNRGMRPAARPTRPRRRTRPARAPPIRIPIPR